MTPDEIRKASNVDDSILISSVENAINILEIVQRLDDARNVDVVTETGMSKGAVHKHLETLRKNELLTKDDGVYSLSFRFLDFGEYVREKYPGADYIRVALDKLVDETGELAYYITEEHGKAVIVFRRSGSESVKTQSRAGMRLYMHQSAGGKAILAHKPESFINDIVEIHGLPAATEHTITNPDELHATLEEIRAKGYALNCEESSRGIHAVSVPIFDKNEKIQGACSVVGPKYRLSGKRFKEELPDLILTVANELELNLKHSRH